MNDFSQAKSFIDSGYVATTVLMDSIKKNVSRRESKEERRMKREASITRKPDMFYRSGYCNRGQTCSGRLYTQAHRSSS